MNINPGNTILNNTKNPNFGAIRIATYTSHIPTSKAENFDVLQLEKSDCNYLKKLVNSINNFYNKHKLESDEERKEMTKVTFQVAQTLLSGKQEDKLQVFMAFKDKTPLGIIIGNAIKSNKKGELAYSSRNNHKRRETELDYFVTWGGNKLKGIGTALINEFFIGLKALGFKKVYVRSEIPERSCAHRFYRDNGFKDIGKGKPKNIIQNSDYNYINANDGWTNAPIIPMIATSKRVSETIKKNSALMCRNPIKNNTSFSLMEYYI